MQTQPKNGNRKSKIVRLASVLFVIILAWPHLAEAQGKVYRIGYLSPRVGIDSNAQGFRQGLGELGYVEGQSIVVEWREL